MRILFISSEVAPFAKTGGLADVSAALPKALAQTGQEVAVFMPFYNIARDKAGHFEDTGEAVFIPTLGNYAGGKFFKGLLPDSQVPLFLLENHNYFSRDGIYDGPNGQFGDNVERFSFFCRAVLEFCGTMNFYPDIIHCNDWQTALVPLYLKTLYRYWANFKNSKTVLTIHNMAFQGRFWKDDIKLTGLSWDLFNKDCLEFYDSLNLMKGGLSATDIITTVSPNYAMEIQTESGGFQLEGVLRNRSRSLFGIVNGVDYNEWDPQTDTDIPANYHPGDLGGKSICKNYVQKLFGMRVSDEIPLVTLVSRLTGQKGINLIQQTIEYFLSQNRCQLLLLGSGEDKYCDFFRYLGMKYPDLCHAEIGYNDEFAHKFIAAADLFLMPSAFEPCGLTQLYSLKYGTVPLVRDTGGLSDTITPVTYDSLVHNKATGFMFEQFSGRAFGECLDVALKFYHNRDAWKKLQLTGMNQDWSWKRSGEQYLRLYHQLHGWPM